MRCIACDKRLSGRESSFRGLLSGEYLDTCKECLDLARIQYTENPLAPEESIENNEVTLEDESENENEE